MFFIIPLLLFFSSCKEANHSKTDKEKESDKITYPYDPDDVIYDIINATLKDLVPKPNNSESTILITEKLLVADKELIKEFIDLGADKSLLEIDRNKSSSQTFNMFRVKDFNNLKVLHTYPLTSSEFNKNLGGVNYSRIVINEDTTKAHFIYHFERLHQKESKILCAVEVTSKNGVWIISSKVCLQNHSGMLYY